MKGRSSDVALSHCWVEISNTPAQWLLQIQWTPTAHLSARVTGRRAGAALVVTVFFKRAPTTDIWKGERIISDVIYISNWIKHIWNAHINEFKHIYNYTPVILLYGIKTKFPSYEHFILRWCWRHNVHAGLISHWNPFFSVNSCLFLFVFLNRLICLSFRSIVSMIYCGG